MRKSSFLTVTDQFCGAGGSSIGATAAGVELRMAVNHWRLAIDTHAANFPHADHDCVDVSACDPRRYPSTDILITSPECTNHSLAKGRKRRHAGQFDAFVPRPDDPSEERSRATMWDVPRFAEYHRYRIIIVENVVDARSWLMWDAWLLAMDALGYRHRCVYLNSMFAHPTPQSRDRMYVVFWRKGNRAPNLDYRPDAPCARCERVVESRQMWKNGRTAGRYRRQYLYACPECRSEVTPFYYAALNAIDWSLPAERIGDRTRPLKDRTLERIRFGLERYGRRPLVLRTNMTSGVGCRVRDGLTAPMDTQPGSNITALVHAFVVETLFSHAPNRRPVSITEPLPTRSTRLSDAVVMPRAFMAGFRGTGTAHIASGARGLDDAATTVTAHGTHHALVTDGAMMTMRDAGRFVYGDAIDVTPTQVATCSQTAVIARSPYLVSYYGQHASAPVSDPVDTVTTLDRHALIEPGLLAVEDCYFRMFAPHEIGAAMAFPSTYRVLGTNRDRVKQFGNAVTPPAMTLLIQRCVASLHPEVAA